MIRQPDRVKQLLLTGMDPETSEISAYFALGHIAADCRAYISVAQPDFELEDKQAVANQFAGSVGLELLHAIEASGQAPTDELLNELSDLVFMSVEAEIRESHPEFVIPPRPVFRVPTGQN